VTAAFLVAALFALLLLRVPIAIALGLSSIVTLLLFAEQALVSLAQRFFSALQLPALLAIPFFVLAGAFLTTGGVAKRMIAFANALVGHFRGGLAMAALLASALFAAVSGSSPATVAAVGTIMIAGMVRSGYTREFAAGLICNAGTLGILIPPSIVMVVYGAVTETSVGRLFMAGVVPGIVLTAALMLAVAVIARRRGFPRQPPAGWRAVLRAGRDAIWGLMLVVIVLGGIYRGVFTPTEAAAVSAVYAFVIAVFVYRDVPWRDVPRVVAEAAKVTAMLMFIIGNAYLFSFVLLSEQVPQSAAAAIASLGMPPWAFLVAVNLVLLLAGSFMEATSVILIFAPILVPIAATMGIDPVHLGIVMTINMEIGMITPPVGLNLFVAAGIAKLPVTAVVRAAAPWLVVLLGVLVLVTYVPSLSLALPRWLG
jgi:C4-dicarboxylate transporter DctM subunit